MRFSCKLTSFTDFGGSDLGGKKDITSLLLVYYIFAVVNIDIMMVMNMMINDILLDWNILISLAKFRVIFFLNVNK